MYYDHIIIIMKNYFLYFLLLVYVFNCYSVKAQDINRMNTHIACHFNTGISYNNLVFVNDFIKDNFNDEVYFNKPNYFKGLGLALSFRRIVHELTFNHFKTISTVSSSKNYSLNGNAISYLFLYDIHQTDKINWKTLIGVGNISYTLLAENKVALNSFNMLATNIDCWSLSVGSEFRFDPKIIKEKKGIGTYLGIRLQYNLYIGSSQWSKAPVSNTSPPNFQSGYFQCGLVVGIY